MSSHHFVREGQEPALLIVDPLSLMLVEPLLEWAPVVIVSTNAIADVLKWKIKIDVVLSQQDAVHAHADEIINQGPIEILYYRHNEDIPDVVITFLAQRKCRGVNVIAQASPDVFDRWIPKAREFDISIIDVGTKWSAIQSVFQKWLPKKTELRVRSSPEVSLRYAGLMHETGALFLTEGDGVIFIQSDTPFWLGESLEN